MIGLQNQLCVYITRSTIAVTYVTLICISATILLTVHGTAVPNDVT